jgi:zinc transport system substrate-binding protein
LRIKKIAGIILIVAAWLIGCSNQQQETSATQEDKTVKESEILKIFTTLYPLEDFTKKIGGNFVEVDSIIPPGADTHTYEPTTKQMTEIANADAFIFNGLGMEPYADKITLALENEHVSFIEATYGLEVTKNVEHSHEPHEEEELTGTGDHEHDEHEHDEHSSHDEHEHDEHFSPNEETVESKENSDEAAQEHEHHHGEVDPHVWLDPQRSILIADNIKNKLVELNPSAKVYFESNYLSLKSELEDLDKQFQQVAKISENPEFLVSHAAYGYWEHRYGIKQIAISGLSPSNEPSQRELKNLVELVQQKQFKYILFEKNVSSKISEIIQEELNAKPLYLHNLETLTEDDTRNGEDYFSIMTKNLETLEKVLTNE